MHRQIETADFNISSENNRMIMSEEERVKKNKTKLKHFPEIKAKEWNKCNNV